jgi:hypothetical protein
MRKVFEAGTKDELDKTFAAFVEQHGRALVVEADPFFLGQRDQIVALLPSIGRRGQTPCSFRLR